MSTLEASRKIKVAFVPSHRLLLIDVLQWFRERVGHQNPMRGVAKTMLFQLVYNPPSEFKVAVEQDRSVFEFLHGLILDAMKTLSLTSIQRETASEVLELLQSA